VRCGLDRRQCAGKSTVVHRAADLTRTIDVMETPLSRLSRCVAAPVNNVCPRLSPELAKLTYNKLALINAAENINDLRVPPGNRLEKLAGDRAGQHSVRVNDQWRLCFTWSTGGASNVELVDYH